MPSGIGASYRSLADDVYKSTTVAENKFSVIESVKKAFSFSSNATRRSDPLLTRSDSQQATPEGAANRDRKMPASASAEETALLG